MSAPHSIFLEQVIEKDNHPEADPQRIGYLKNIRMLVTPPGQYLHDPHMHLLHADVGMEIHNRQCRTKEQQQPDQYKQGNRRLARLKRTFNLYNSPPSPIG